MSMQMDAYLKKEQIGTLFVWVGAPEGGFRGWVVGQGGPSQKLGMPVQILIFNRLHIYQRGDTEAQNGTVIACS